MQIHTNFYASFIAVSMQIISQTSDNRKPHKFKALQGWVVELFLLIFEGKYIEAGQSKIYYQNLPVTGSTLSHTEMLKCKAHIW